MGVDSGLPDFRGDQGFWRAYPPFERLGLRFTDLANPTWFVRDPALAWGFYGHRLELYRRTVPHAGFAHLLRWAKRAPKGSFVFTSNVDGQFQRAGFDPLTLCEVHGAIDWLQCTAECGVGLFSADPFHLDLDLATFRARDPLPACPRCGALARPNILMFGDGDFDPTRSQEQHARFTTWLDSLHGGRLVIIECGAGTAIPTVRHLSETVATRERATIIRLDVREPEVPPGHFGFATGALAGLNALATPMGEPTT